MDKHATKPIVGLLGAPGSGKSTVAHCFEKHGAGVVDADQLARAALNSQAVQDELRSAWGNDVFSETGQVDRAAVAKKVFQNDEQKKFLESLVHPRVAEGRAELHREFEADPAVRLVVEDCPLLLETGLDEQCDVLLLVEASEAVRLGRVEKNRCWGRAELEQREKNQWSLDIKRQRADYVIVNEGSEAGVCQDVERLIDPILKDHRDR
jgi:dephospho-CoA kinase